MKKLKLIAISLAAIGTVMGLTYFVADPKKPSVTIGSGLNNTGDRPDQAMSDTPFEGGQPLLETPLVEGPDAKSGPLQSSGPLQAAGPLQSTGPLQSAMPLPYTGPIVGNMPAPGPDMPQVPYVTAYNWVPYVNPELLSGTKPENLPLLPPGLVYLPVETPNGVPPVVTCVTCGTPGPGPNPTPNPLPPPVYGNPPTGNLSPS